MSGCHLINTKTFFINKTILKQKVYNNSLSLIQKNYIYLHICDIQPLNVVVYRVTLTCEQKKSKVYFKHKIKYC